MKKIICDYLKNNHNIACYIVPSYYTNKNLPMDSWIIYHGLKRSKLLSLKEDIEKIAEFLKQKEKYHPHGLIFFIRSYRILMQNSKEISMIDTYIHSKE